MNTVPLRDRWRKCDTSDDMQQYLVSLKLSSAALRLFAIRSAAHVGALFVDQRSFEALRVAERYANGLATDDDLRMAYISADAVSSALEDALDDANNVKPYHASLAAAWTVVDIDYADAAYSAAHAAYYARMAGGDAELEYQADVLQLIVESA
jgi:hypothetical protein